MNWKEYQPLANQTASGGNFNMDPANSDHFDLAHGVVGISTEAGELLDQWKKHVFYGKGLDVQNVREEIGDLCWYIALVTKALKLDFDEILAGNIRKLEARYGGKFSQEKAINRNVKQEMSAMDLV